MPLSLTCDCGARFEVEDALAGQTVSCPECQASLKAPAARRPVVRTSNFALASFFLAIVGAFTVVGSVAAAVLGLIGAAAILRDRERQAGLGFAVTGVVLGIACTALTLFGFSQRNLFYNWQRGKQLSIGLDQKDMDKSVAQSQDGYDITKPIGWAKAVLDSKDPEEQFGDPCVQVLLQGKAPSLLLVQPDLDAFVTVEVEPDPGGTDDSIDNLLLTRLKPPTAATAAAPGSNPGAGSKDLEEEMRLKVQSCERSGARDQIVHDVKVYHEMTVKIRLKTAQAVPKAWTMLVRTYRKGGQLFIVRGFAETERFDGSEKVGEKLGQVMDTFKVTGR